METAWTAFYWLVFSPWKNFLLLRLSTDGINTTLLQQQLQINADSKSVSELSFNVSGQERLSNNLPGILVQWFIGTLQCRIPHRTLTLHGWMMVEKSRVNQLNFKLLISSQAELSVLLHLKQFFSCLEREVFSVLWKNDPPPPSVFFSFFLQFKYQ